MRDHSPAVLAIALETRPAPMCFRACTMKGKVAVGPCCFCGNPIEPTAIDPCRLTIETSENRWQVWYCHSTCFHERLVLPNLTQTGTERR